MIKCRRQKRERNIGLHFSRPCIYLSGDDGADEQLPTSVSCISCIVCHWSFATLKPCVHPTARASLSRLSRRGTAGNEKHLNTSPASQILQSGFQICKSSTNISHSPHGLLNKILTKKDEGEMASCIVQWHLKVPNAKRSLWHLKYYMAPCWDQYYLPCSKTP